MAEQHEFITPGIAETIGVSEDRHAENQRMIDESNRLGELAEAEVAKIKQMDLSKLSRSQRRQLTKKVKGIVHKMDSLRAKLDKRRGEVHQQIGLMTAVDGQVTKVKIEGGA